MNFYTGSQERIKLNDNPLGRGGEGNVYEVVSPSYKGFVAKIYHPKERRKERELKLIYLLSHRPQLEDHLSVIWPEEILYENEAFVGFLMRKANSAIDLTSLCSLRIPARLGPAWKHKYDRNTDTGLQNRMKVCKNIAAALLQMHQTGNYVLLDIKPENIKVNLKGEVSIIDIDSIEVVLKNRLVFPADKTSLEYSPAEIKKLNIKEDVVEDTWDRFSMAVVFYKVLFGLHPFTGTCKPPFDKLVSNEEKIAQGLFPMGVQKEHFEVIPQPHKAFYAIAASIQKLFIRCFGEGHAKPTQRPSAAEWLSAFRKSPRFDPIDRHYKPKEKSALAKRFSVKRIKASLPSLIKSTVAAVALSGMITVGVIQLTSFKLPENFLSNPHIDKNQAMMLQAKKNKMFIGRFNEGMAKAKKDGKYALIDEKGKGTSFKYDWADNYQEGAARAAINEKYGFVDKKGKEIIPLKYDWVGKFSEGLAKVELNGKTGFIDQNNKLVIPFQYDDADNFREGLAAVRIGEKWGLINNVGHMIIFPKYKLIKNFFEGRALVQQMDNKIGFINQSGYEVIKPQYYWATSFIDGKALVRTYANKEMHINIFGQIISFK